MNNHTKSIGIHLTKEERKKYIDEIISFYVTEREEQIDIIASHELLDFFLQTLGPLLYNKAADDVQKLVHDELESINFKIELLKK